ncbi:unnamed protein product [Bathycoccus prasinos]
MATTITVLSEDGKSKITLKSLPPMKPLRDCLLECASKLGMISSSSTGGDALEFRLVKEERGKGSSSSSSGGVKVDMDCPLRHLNLPTNAKLKLFKKRTLTVGSDVLANEESSLREGGGEAPPLHVEGASPASAANIDAAEKKDKKEDETMEERSAVLSDDVNDATSPSSSSVLGKRAARVVRQKTLDAEAEERKMDPTTGLVSANEELPEAFFELSSAEAAQIVASNRRKLENGNALLTKKHREREAQRRREKVRHATIRIMFQQKPISDVCVEAVFDAHKETVEDVYAFVEEILSKDDKSTQNAPSFELFVAPPKRVLKRNGRDANQSLYDAGLAPAAKIFFSLKTAITTTSSFEEVEESALLSTKCLEMLRLHDQKSSASAPIRPKPPPKPPSKEEDQEDREAKVKPTMSDQAKKSFVPKWFKK